MAGMGWEDELPGLPMWWRRSHIPGREEEYVGGLCSRFETGVGCNLKTLEDWEELAAHSSNLGYLEWVVLVIGTFNRE